MFMQATFFFALLTIYCMYTVCTYRFNDTQEDVGHDEN